MSSSCSEHEFFSKKKILKIWRHNHCHKISHRQEEKRKAYEDVKRKVKRHEEIQEREGGRGKKVGLEVGINGILYIYIMHIYISKSTPINYA